jgi:short subunit dehydrogenase-like uncharacterized protein
MEKNKWVIYGSYGYTGSLIAEIAARSNQTVILAGRDEKKLSEQASRLNLKYRKTELKNPDELDDLLNDAKLVIHCAGPFINTWKPMADACIRNRCHYIDITGEVDVFESLKKMDYEFGKAGIMALPGAGFDVVPSDCLAMYLKSKLPDAISLEMAFQTSRRLSSRGTMKTISEHLGRGGLVRRDGKLIAVRSAWKTKKIDVGNGPVSVISIPWGDLSAAYTSTGIENITVYMAMKPSDIRLVKVSNLVNPLLRSKFVRTLIKKGIELQPPGPTEKERESGKSYFWGKVKNPHGETAEMRLITPEGYKLTAESACLIAYKIASDDFKPGYQTPTTAYGKNLIFEINGVKSLDQGE